MTCTFFGHRDCPYDVGEDLRNAIIDLIENKGVDCFLVGNNGNFDSLVLSTLRKSKSEFPHIDYCVVLAYLFSNSRFDYPTLYPEGIESIPRKYAISYRNDYMLKQSDFVVAYITHNSGGAYRFFSLAKNQGKTCINLYKT
ncbi:MAG: hypothetical protein IJO20_01580 [Ruminococcus sp.]|nr:hypothetical protein [Ruminococcus sp.]